MLGWEAEGDSFRFLLNQNCEIPAEASRVSGYTPEILERDGYPPDEVYEKFRSYAGGLPIVAYNIAYDWNQVLIPEWERLGIDPVGYPGFCALRLAERLLDPVPAGNCKLQTLRQYYYLPERGAHTALGDVNTVIDLMQLVLRPVAEERNLSTWDALARFTSEEWFPSRIAFGEFRGRLFFEASHDSRLKSWLEWLAKSQNPKSRRMGNWYLDQLAAGAERKSSVFVRVSGEKSASKVSRTSAVIIYRDPELKLYQSLIATSRDRLAEVELEFSVEKARVDAVRSRLFQALRPTYQERDLLRRLIQYRNIFIERLLSDGEETAGDVRQEHQKAAEADENEYESTASALEGKHALSDEETEKLKKLWKKLVRMFHPDQYENDLEKRDTFEKITQIINEAREHGDIEMLERIARDPDRFILEQGWTAVSFATEEQELPKARALYEFLQARILKTLEALETLRQSAEFELFQLTKKSEAAFAEVIAEQQAALEAELVQLRAEAEQKAREIEELTGTVPF